MFIVLRGGKMGSEKGEIAGSTTELDFTSLSGDQKRLYLDMLNVKKAQDQGLERVTLRMTLDEASPFLITSFKTDERRPETVETRVGRIVNASDIIAIEAIGEERPREVDDPLVSFTRVEKGEDGSDEHWPIAGFETTVLGLSLVALSNSVKSS